MGETINELIEEVSPYYKSRAKKKKQKLLENVPELQNTLVYDSSSETLEPIYFFVLDLMNSFGLKVEKIYDNFSSAPGSGHFGELGQRTTVMQQQGSKLMGDINTLIRSILNLIYDLKEFRIRLDHYDDFKSKDSKVSESAKLSLKQLWMDKVDIQKGNSALKALVSTQIGFVTVIDGFLAANTVDEAKKLDLNDRVKRIVISRFVEFEIWLKESESELRKRYQIERTYLKSQVSSLKIYIRWVKPYLKAAQELEQKEQGRNPNFIKTFNTILLELTLLGKRELDKTEIPPEAAKLIDRASKRKYYACCVLEFKFRGIPQKFSQRGDYAFGGKAEVTYSAYALNEDEIEALNQKLDETDLADGLKLIESATSESLEQLQSDIDFFINDEKEESKEKKSEETNPFLALIGYYEKPESKKEKEKKSNEKIKVKEDNWFEAEHLRRNSIQVAMDVSFDMFDTYKKAHGMASYT